MTAATFHHRLLFTIARFEFRTRLFAAGHALIAIALLSELLFAPLAALFHPVGATTGPRCEAIRAISIFCISGPDNHLEFKRIVIVAILVVAAIGYRPRYCAAPYLWAVFSMADSFELPDGGDAIALISVIILFPVLLVDGRTWMWSGDRGHIRLENKALCYVAIWALRLQFAYIYLDSAIAKMGVKEWADGTAMYYIFRDKMFGAQGILQGFWLWVSQNPIGTLSITWGTILLEMLIALFTLLGPLWRKLALYMTAFLHIAIFFSTGLFSFSAVMIGVALVIAGQSSSPPAHRPRSQSTWIRRVSASAMPADASPSAALSTP